MEEFPDNAEKQPESKAEQTEWDELGQEVPFKENEIAPTEKKDEDKNLAEKDKNAIIREKLEGLCDEMGIEKTKDNVARVNGILRTETWRQELLDISKQHREKTDHLDAELEAFEAEIKEKGVFERLFHRAETVEKERELNHSIHDSLWHEWNSSYEAETHRRRSAQVAVSLLKIKIPYSGPNDFDEYLAAEEAVRRKFLASPVAKELGEIDEKEYGKSYREYEDPHPADVQQYMFEEYVGMRA